MDILPIRPSRYIDLTHTLMPDIPSWDGGCGFEKNILFDYELDIPANETTFLVHGLSMAAGTGTHVDAPSHCCPGAANIADIPLSDLISPCVLVDISARAADDDRYVVSMEDIRMFESEFGPISKGNFVIFRTGWDKYWMEGSSYRNDLRFPSVSPVVATYLVDADITGIGIDTLSPDCDGSGFPVHRIVLSAGRYIVENLTNLGAVPAIGSTIIVLPIKLHGCTEAPARVMIALPP